MIEFGALISGLGTSLEIAKTLSTLKGENERAIAVAELTRSIADTQNQLLATLGECVRLTQENSDLKKQLEKDQRFDRYCIRKVEYSGDVIFTLKGEFVTQEEPAHDICPLCKEAGRVSYLAKDELYYRCKYLNCGFLSEHTRHKYNESTGHDRYIY